MNHCFSEIHYKLSYSTDWIFRWIECKGTTLERGRTTKPQQKPAFLPLPSVFPLHTLSQHLPLHCRLFLFIIAQRFTGLGMVFALYNVPALFNTFLTIIKSISQNRKWFLRIGFAVINQVSF